MLQNDNHKFIFVHIQKTAGSSIRNRLMKIPKTYDICGYHCFISQYKYPNEYFKFAFVRNPWDRLVSWYNMFKTKSSTGNFRPYMMKDTKNFSDFLNKQNIIIDGSEKKSITFNQLDYLSDKDGNVVMDYIGRFENLKYDLNEIAKKIGVNELSIPHVNKTNHGHYREYYNDEDREKVAQMYKRDIEYFGYKF